jgi:hypothetical protein
VTTFLRRKREHIKMIMVSPKNASPDKKREFERKIS